MILIMHAFLINIIIIAFNRLIEKINWSFIQKRRPFKGLA